jgi:hypothetical protein
MSSRRNFVLASLLASCGLCVWSCAPDKPPTPPVDPPKLRATFFPADEHLMSRDAFPPQEYLIQLASYKITVPAGTISGNKDFWGHIDENAVDVPTHDLLWKNGVRVGVAASSEWDFFKAILEQNPAITQPSSYAGREAKDIEMEMKMQVPYQNLFYFDTQGELIGRTFERCDNLLRVSFQPAPRKPGSVRLGMCPVVRSMRERIVAVGDINTISYQFIHPEQFFELNLSVDIPMDGFLIVAPSPEGKWPSSLGGNFFVGDGTVEQFETLLIFRPLTYRQKTIGKTPATTQP